MYILGWSIYIESDQSILEQNVDIIVKEIPEILNGPSEQMGIKPKRTDGGWHSACDIFAPEDKTLRIGGSYGMSGHIAEQMAEHLKKELEKQGHKIKLKYNW